MNPTVSVRRNSVPFFIYKVIHNNIKSWSYVDIMMGSFYQKKVLPKGIKMIVIEDYSCPLSNLHD